MACSWSAAAERKPVSRQVGHALPPAEHIDVHVGGRLRARRIAVGLSQGALARQLGITFSQVQKYEKGANRIGAGRLYHVAALLDVPVQYFFEGLGEPAAAEEPASAARTEEAAQLQAVFAAIAEPEARKALLSLALSMTRGG